MTDDDKALVGRLEEWALTLLAACEGGDLGTDEPAALMYQAADRIEALSAENERLHGIIKTAWFFASRLTLIAVGLTIIWSVLP